MGTFDFIIIGAGMAGASAAAELAPFGSVLVLEKEDHPGTHATGRSAAFYSQTYGNETIRLLTSASRSFFMDPPTGFCEAPLLSPSGALFIGRADQTKSLDQHFQETASAAEGVTREDANFARQKCPALRPNYVAGCVWESGSQAIDVNALLQGYLKSAKHTGAIFKFGINISAIEQSGDGWTIRANTGDFSCNTLINAAGAWADQIAQLAGIAPIGLAPLRRSVCVIDGPEDQSCKDWPLVIDVDEEFYFKPDGNMLWLSPADETLVEPCDAYPEDMDIAHAVDRFEKATTLKVKRVHHQWAGLRTFAPDKAPVAGFEPSAPGFFWLAGQGGYGIQTAPAMAKLSAALARRQNMPADLIGRGLDESALSPIRFR
jgi:D-arginine dehydrogenase